MSTLKHVCSSSRDLCDIADEVEKLYGFGVCVVSLSTVGPNALYIDKRFPTWERAYEYARELIVWPADPCNCGNAACESSPGHCGAYNPNKAAIR